MTPVTDARQSIEALASKMGLVLLVLGGMHFFNLVLFSKIRTSALNSPQADARRRVPRARATRPTSEPGEADELSFVGFSFVSPSPSLEAV